MIFTRIGVALQDRREKARGERCHQLLLPEGGKRKVFLTS